MIQGKKILLAVTNDLTHDRRMQRICGALASAGAEVTLIGRKLGNSEAFHPDGYQGVRLNCFFFKKWVFYLEYTIRLFFFLLFSRYDIACACDLDTAPAVRLASWIRRKKTVYDAHEYFTEVPELIHRPRVKAIWEWIAGKTIPGFDLCYTVGEELAAIMGKRYGVPFHVIRNIAPSPDTVNETTDITARGKILLYQGALNIGRGLEVCIEAMQHLPDWRFLLAGEGDITRHLHELVKQYGVGDRVQFLGWVSPGNLPALLGQARLCINLREAGSLNDFYSLPNKFFDAIHAGVPSINMNYPEYARVNAKYPCSLLIHEVGIDQIVAAIRSLDLSPDTLRRMAEACRTAAQEYSWAKERERLVRLYD